MTFWPEQHIQEIAEGIVAVRHGQGEAGVANAACVFEQGRALVVDTMTFPEMIEGLVRDIARRDAHVDMVINTHHHIDHTGGNQAFAGTPIVAHPTTKRELEKMARLPGTFYEQLLPKFSGRFGSLQLHIPDTLPEQLIIPRGGEVFIFHAAHSPADLAVWFPQSRVLLAGDLSFIEVTPMAAHGTISGWIAALDTLIELQPMVVVPGHGRPGTLQDLLDLRTYFCAVLTAGQLAVKENLTYAEVLSTLEPGPVAEWIETGRTRLNLERAMAEVRGELDLDNLVTLSLPGGIGTHTKTGLHVKSETT